MNEWSEFSSCSKACGGGDQIRTRAVLRAGLLGGAACGSAEEIRACNVQACHQDCQLEDWTEWTPCSRRCRFESTAQPGHMFLTQHLATYASSEGVCPGVEVSCFTREGIDAIRAALLAGAALGTDASPIRVRLIAPPIYVLSTTTLDKDAGVALLQRAIDVVTEEIGQRGGKMDVKMAPKAVSLKEETELQATMERLELENREVEGDEPEED